VDWPEQRTGCIAAHLEPVVEGGLRAGDEIGQLLLIALAADARRAVGTVVVAQIEGDELGGGSPGAIQSR